MTITQLRNLLPTIEIEDSPYCIGYWLRVAKQPRPVEYERRRGWDRADREIAEERAADHALAAVVQS